MRSWQRGSQADRRKQKNETTIRNAKKGNSKKCRGEKGRGGWSSF